MYNYPPKNVLRIWISEECKNQFLFLFCFVGSGNIYNLLCMTFSVVFFFFPVRVFVFHVFFWAGGLDRCFAFNWEGGDQYWPFHQWRELTISITVVNKIKSRFQCLLFRSPCQYTCLEEARKNYHLSILIYKARAVKIFF